MMRLYQLACTIARLVQRCLVPRSQISRNARGTTKNTTLYRVTTPRKREEWYSPRKKATGVFLLGRYSSLYHGRCYRKPLTRPADGPDEPRWPDQRAVASPRFRPSPASKLIEQEENLE